MGLREGAERSKEGRGGAETHRPIVGGEASRADGRGWGIGEVLMKRSTLEEGLKGAWKQRKGEESQSTAKS